jgi:hypothetical protein
MSLREALRRMVLLSLLTATAGCGSDDGPTLARVQGTVKHDNKPLANALVVFLPETPGALSASGTTDNEGYYQLMTRSPGDGVLIGKHRVTVMARGPDQKLPEDQNPTGLPGGNFVPGDPLIPEKYFSPETSGLTAEVKSGKNTLDFELTK